MKKLLCVLFAAVFAFGLLLPAFAAEAGTPEANSEYFETGDYTLHYRVFPAEDPRGQIMMIHGFALSSYCFEPLAERLSAAGYTCVTVDLPDFGFSSRETAATEKQPREDLIHALMTSLSDEPWYVAAHSMGGYIALALAEKYPESVRQLLLYGTAGNDAKGSALDTIVNNTALRTVLGKFMTVMSRTKPIVRMFLYMATKDLKYTMDYDLTRITDPYQIDGTGEGALFSFAMLPATNYDAIGDMPPILYMNAENDSVIAKSAIEKLKTYLPDGSTVVTLSDGGHLFIECRADKTAAETLAFLG